MASADGAVTFRRTGPGPTATSAPAVTGADPLADQSPDRLVGLDAERADPHPPRATNSYPFAYDHVAQLFDHPAAPDLCVLHTAAHNWEDQGGHRGEHGSLGVVQARAPFVIAGKGVRNDGLVPRAGRLVDVAPTVAELLGCAPDDRGHHLAGQDGVVRDDVLDVAGGRPRHVVGFLFDGVNPNVLYAMAAAGEAPERRPPHRDGHRLRVGRDGRAADGHARQPHVDPHRPPPRPPRHPAQRVVRPGDAASR